jgi:hypothetical protein
MKKIVIVGNADVKADHSEFVNSCDLVVRFNLCRNYKKNTGDRVDILCLVNSWKPGRRHCKSGEVSQLCFIKSLKQVWFYAPPKPFWNNICAHIFKDIQALEYREYSKKIIERNGLSDKHIEYTQKEIHEALHKKLQANGAAKYSLPSSGMSVIEKIVSGEKYQEYKKYIVGFTYEGWSGHPWAAEKKLIDDYMASGILIRLDP